MVMEKFKAVENVKKKKEKENLVQILISFFSDCFQKDFAGWESR